MVIACALLHSSTLHGVDRNAEPPNSSLFRSEERCQNPAAYVSLSCVHLSKSKAPERCKERNTPLSIL